LEGGIAIGDEALRDLGLGDHAVEAMVGGTVDV
jgi:hypothetical protein